MSYDAGMAALRLEMPDIVPRTEYSVEEHWPLIRKVTGLPVTPSSSDEEKKTAQAAFFKAWDYGMNWNILVHNNYLTGRKTSMGHAVYAEDGSDFQEAAGCPFDTPEEALAFEPAEEYGIPDHHTLVSQFNANWRAKCDAFGDTVNMTGIYITLMSGLIEILGWDMLLLSAGTDPVAFGALANRYTDWIAHHFEALAACDSPVVKIHDDIVWTEGAFLHPDWYRKYIFPNFKRLFAPLREAGKIILFTSDGNFTQFIDDIAQTGVNGFVMEPCTDMAYLAEQYGKTHVFVGNADTRVLLSGSREQIYNEVKRCIDIGKSCPGFLLAVGNHIPPNTPVEAALYYNECYEQLRRR